MHTPTHRAARFRQTGITIVELMVAMAIGLFMLAGLVGIFANSNRAYLELNRSSQQIENGRFAVQVLADDLSLAGFFGRYYLSATPAAVPDPCEINDMAALRAALSLPVYGWDAPASPAAPVSTCITGANHVDGTDILVVRRADSQATASGSLVAQDVYLQSNADSTSSINPIIALGTAGNFTLKDRDAATTSTIRKMHVHVYFVAPCSVPTGGGLVCTGATDDNGAPIPTLKRLELRVDSGVRSMRIVPLVEGIENFQIDYGVDSDTDGVPDGAYVTAPATLTDWANVVAIRVNLLARNLEATSGFTDTKIYDMGVAGTVTPGGAYKRHVYNSVIRLVNPSARREPTT